MTTNNGAGGLVAMRGRCESADFENDTLTFKMDGDYYAAAGEYVITPAALQAPGEAVPCKTVIVYGDHGPEEREPVEDYYTAPPSDALRRVVEALEGCLRPLAEAAHMAADSEGFMSTDVVAQYATGEEGRDYYSMAHTALIKATEALAAAHKALAEGVERG